MPGSLDPGFFDSLTFETRSHVPTRPRPAAGAFDPGIACRNIDNDESVFVHQDGARRRSGNGAPPDMPTPACPPACDAD